MKAFISHSHQLAAWFTQPAWYNREVSGKYMEDGLKPIEAFCSDIKRNLINWAIEGNTIFYRTKEFWYMFQLETAAKIFGPLLGSGKIVWMTRYRNGSWERVDDWANPHSVEYIGKNFLKDQPDKQLPLFNSS